jgi:hypothetical protein
MLPRRRHGGSFSGSFLFRPHQVNMRPASLALLALSCAASSAAQQCTTAKDCNLNGFCVAGECNCQNPWYGPNCEELAYALTPASGKSLFDSGASHNNTWGGPIMTAPDGAFHIFVPLYRNGSLSGPTRTKHGVAQVWVILSDLILGYAKDAVKVFFVKACVTHLSPLLWTPRI